MICSHEAAGSPFLTLLFRGQDSPPASKMSKGGEEQRKPRGAVSQEAGVGGASLFHLRTRRAFTQREEEEVTGYIQGTPGLSVS